MAIPRNTHTWLKALYDRLEGKTAASLVLGSSTGVIGLYGASGTARLATGTAGITGVTGAGGNTGPSVWWFNGGSGNYYRIDDLVVALKNAGVLKP